MFDPNNFDLSINPSDDFNKFVNGEWMKNNDIPSKYTRWGTFEILHEENLQKIKDLIINSSDYFSKLKTYYDIAINENKINNEKEKPLLTYINLIDSCISKDELWNILSDFYIKGLVGIFGLYPEEDMKDSSLVVAYLSMGGLTLPDRDYYFDENKEETRKKLKLYFKNVLRLFNKNSLYDSYVDKIFNIEKELASKTYTRVEKRDPEKNYNKMTVQNLTSDINLDWNGFFNKITNNKELPYVIVDNPDLFKKFKELWDTQDLDVWKTFFKTKLIMGASPYLSAEYVDLRFDFFNKELSGQKEIKPRWERVISMMNSDIGELIGRIYVEKHFTETAKNKMNDMVNRLNKELKRRIINLSWMSEDTKKKALLKNEAFRAKIGYPDVWRDYNLLEFSKDNSLLDITIKCSEFNHYHEMDRLFKPTDPNRWEMDPHNINAYFHPLKNEIVFPAGILQAPFFDVNAEDPFNYGAIGTVIGHEMTHSYDDMGRKFDHNGNLNNWWTEQDLENFKQRAKYYIDEFSSFKSNDKNINGELTLGENLADHGGVKISYYALLNKLGKDVSACEDEVYTTLNMPVNYISLESLTPEQKFFIAWGQIWKGNITKEELDKRIITDPHSPGEWRINGTLANIPEFHKAFNIESGTKMYRENPVQMW